MPQWIITDDQGFEGNANEAMQTLVTLAEESGKGMKLWKLHSTAAVDVEVVVTTEDD